MANICTTRIAIEGAKETLEKIFSVLKKAEKGEIDYWGGNILLALGKKDISETGFYGWFAYVDDIEETKEEGIFVLRLGWEDKWTRGDFIENLQELFPEIVIYWMAEEFGCGYWETNDTNGRYFGDRFAVISDDDWEYFETEDDILNYLKEHFDIDSRDEIENYNENNEDGNTVTVYECEEE